MVRKKGRMRRIHSKKWERCIEEVRKSKYDGRKYNPYAVCTKALGKKAFLKRR